MTHTTTSPRRARRAIVTACAVASLAFAATACSDDDGNDDDLDNPVDGVDDQLDEQLSDLGSTIDSEITGDDMVTPTTAGG